MDLLEPRGPRALVRLRRPPASRAGSALAACRRPRRLSLEAPARREGGGHMARPDRGGLVPSARRRHRRCVAEAARSRNCKRLGVERESRCSAPPSAPFAHAEARLAGVEKTEHPDFVARLLDGIPEHERCAAEGKTPQRLAATGSPLARRGCLPDPRKLGQRGQRLIEVLLQPLRPAIVAMLGDPISLLVEAGEDVGVDPDARQVTWGVIEKDARIPPRGRRGSPPGDRRPESDPRWPRPAPAARLPRW